MIELKKINKIYDNNVHALKDVYLKFDEVGLNFIVGKSGSGKSTLLNVIGCLDNFEVGKYYFLNKDITDYSLEELDKIRNYYFGFVFQDFLLVENMNVLENIEFSLNLQHDKNYDKVYEIMKELDIYELKNREITELSGGQRQRVAIARALVKNPSVILADEPTGNLDDASKKGIYELLKKLSKKYLVIIVSHDLIAAEKYADRIIKIDNGRIIDDKINYVTVYSVKDNLNDVLLASNLNKYDLLNLIENGNDFCSLSIEKKKEQKQESKDIEVPKVGRRDRLPNRVIFKYLRKSISSSRLKYIFSSIFYSLTFFLLITFVYLANFKVDVVINNYIDKYNLDTFCLYKNVDYTDSFYDTHQKSILNGYVLKEELLEEFNDIYDVRETKVKIDDKKSDINCYFVDNSVYDLKENEVILTDYISSTYGVKENDAIELYSTTFTIKDIIKTDYSSYDLNSKLESDDHRSYAYNKKKYEYNLCYISSKLKDKVIDADFGIRLSASDFQDSDSDYWYYKSSLIYNSIEKIDSTKLLYGGMPQNNNEIVVSSNYANSVYIYSGNIDSLIGKTYSYKDLSLSSYNGYYSDVINLYKYFNNGVKIVGIVENNDSDIYVNNEIYNKIIEDYKDSLFADYFVVSDFKTKNVSKLLSEDIYFDEVNISFIYSSSTGLNQMSIYFVVLLIILIIISLFMILNHVITQIDKSKKQIGIMKALGVRNKDIIKLFICEIIFIAMITILAAIAIYAATFNFANTKIIEITFEMPFDMFYFDYISVIIVSLVILFAFMLTSIIPVKKLSNKKPMIIIREE